MKFARIVFRVAGIWGIVLLTALYFMFDGGATPPPTPLTYVQSYFGFLGVTMAWQLGFLVIGSDPMRFRPMMIPAMVEKFGFVLTFVVLYLSGRASAAEMMPAVPDVVLGALFVLAFMKTRATNAI